MFALPSLMCARCFNALACMAHLCAEWMNEWRNKLSFWIYRWIGLNKIIAVFLVAPSFSGQCWSSLVRHSFADRLYVSVVVLFVCYFFSSVYPFIRFVFFFRIFCLFLFVFFFFRNIFVISANVVGVGDFVRFIYSKNMFCCLPCTASTL